MISSPKPGPDFSSGLAKSSGNIFKTYLKLRRKDHGPDTPPNGDEQIIEGATIDSAAEYAAKQQARANAAKLSPTTSPSLIQRLRQKIPR